MSSIATTVVESVYATLLDFLHIRHCKSLNVDRAWRTRSCSKVNGENYSKESQFPPRSLSKTRTYLGKVLVLVRRASIKETVALFPLCHYCEGFYSAQWLPQRPPPHMGWRQSGTQRNNKI